MDGKRHRTIRAESITSAAAAIRKTLKLGIETPESDVELAAIEAMWFGYDDAVNDVGTLLGLTGK